MVAHRIYELCQPILEDDELGEEEKTDKLEELLRSEPVSLKGKALEDAVLGALWQWKTGSDTKASPLPIRAPITRSRSPAPWIQRAATPTSTAASSRPSTATSTVLQRSPFPMTKSTSAASPFSSPKASPHLAIINPSISHSPRLNSYFVGESSPITESYGDGGSDTVDWLFNDDASSNASFGDSGFASASEYFGPPTTDMSPYDMLRTILQGNRSDEELEQILELNGYDLSATINSLIDGTGMAPDAMAATLQPPQEQPRRTVLVGKSMSPGSRPVTPAGQQKSTTVCRYWLSSGHCARADCRFAHETQNHICKYWLAGNCIAGNSCLFSHDPALLMQQLSVSQNGTSTPQKLPPNFQAHDYENFPALQPSTSNPFDESKGLDPTVLTTMLQQQTFAHTPPGLFPSFVPTGPRLGNSRPNSRPGSRQNSRAHTPNEQPNLHDDEAFPTLGSAAAKPAGKRHHGKRGGHGHHNHGAAGSQPAPLAAGSLADVVRMSPSPGPAGTNISSKDAMRRGLQNNRLFTSTRENSAAAQAIPAPKDIPWLDTGDRVNAAYLKARQEAFKHGGLRNKFLQSAAQAWNRHDARAAKALSLRGQNENALMRAAHREAARALYDDRNKALAAGGGGGGGSRELYVDLHGLHPEEAVQYLSECLREQKAGPRPVYAICGTGHHSKNGKDKVGKAVRHFLNEWRYAFREFSVPGDRNNVGGILGIDPSTHDPDSVVKKRLAAAAAADDDSAVLLDEGHPPPLTRPKSDTKVLLAKEDPRKK